MKKKFRYDIFKSISSGYVLFFITNIIALILTPYILKHVTKEEYGLYILCVDLFSWIGFLSLGTTKILGPAVASELAKHNDRRVFTLFNASFFFQLLVAILSIPLFYIVCDLSVHENNSLDVNYSFLIFLFAIAAGVEVFNSQFSEMIIAAKKIYIDNFIKLFFTVFRALLILFLIPTYGIFAVFSIYLFISIATIIRNHLRVKKLYPDIQISFALFDLGTLKFLMGDGIFLSIGSIATILTLKFDNFFLSSQVGLDTVSKLYITIKLIVLAQKLVVLLFNNFRPYISAFHGNNNDKKIGDFYIKASEFNYVLCLLSFSITLLINKYFISFWVGEEFYLGNAISLFYGMFYLVFSLSIIDRIVLVSTLSKIKQLSLSLLILGAFRVVVIFILFSTAGIEIIPLSSFAITGVLYLLYTTYLSKTSNGWSSKETIYPRLKHIAFPAIIIVGCQYFAPQTMIYTFFLYALLYVSFYTIRNWDLILKAKTALISSKV